ncbi:unnamed protein product [Cuscuta epithymum]|uniref:Peptidase A1 domain-containing protein n=1 Tax=Cuscuta epithymum TaxID=186058 RepID=A0AAV0DKY3_9ASTE|nr:unnamed protein product [Cuscuta epithymum]
MTLSFPVMFWLVGVITVISNSMLRASSAATTTGFPHHGEGVRVILRRREKSGAGQNLTRLERVQGAVQRDAERLAGLLGVAASERGVMNSSVHSSRSSGEFWMDLSIGTPPVALRFVIDTGSDVIWTNSHSSDSSSTFQIYPCCPALLRDEGTVIQKLRCVPGSKKLTVPGCAYNSSYRDGSWSWGHIAAESFTFESGNVTVESVAFLSADTIGWPPFASKSSSGLVGLGRGNMSLVSQLNVSQFSYCLTDADSNLVSTLTLGGSGGAAQKKRAGGISPITAGRLLESPKKAPYSSFYYVAIKGISVGDTLLDVQERVFEVDGEGRGGMIIDSGTTLTYLPSMAYNALISEVESQSGQSHPIEGSRLCYPRTSYPRSLNLTIHFDNNEKLTIPSENWSVTGKIDEHHFGTCLLFGEALDGEPGIWGNILQQNMLVTYDLAHSALFFEPKTSCG